MWGHYITSREEQEWQYDSHIKVDLKNLVLFKNGIL